MGKSKKQAENGFLKAFKKANREIAFECTPSGGSSLYNKQV